MSDYADCIHPSMALINQNKLTSNEDGKFPRFNFPTDHSYGFDPTKFGLWLRDNICLPSSNFTHLKRGVTDASVNENG